MASKAFSRRRRSVYLSGKQLVVLYVGVIASLALMSMVRGLLG